MYVDMTRGRPIRCSKCGSTNAVKPVNSRDIAIKCGECGHTKLTEEAERRQHQIHSIMAQAWSKRDDADADPTF